jgi:hypothetical protein
MSAAIDPNSILQEGHQKMIFKGVKFYLSVIRLYKRRRYLHLAFKTATHAEEYGRRVVARYRRLVDLASTNEQVADGQKP